MFDSLIREKYYWIEKRFYEDVVNFAVMSRTPWGDIAIKEFTDYGSAEKYIKDKFSRKEEKK